jgi:hypothetical protein
LPSRFSPANFERAFTKTIFKIILTGKDSFSTFGKTTGIFPQKEKTENQKIKENNLAFTDYQFLKKWNVVRSIKSEMRGVRYAVKFAYC